MRLRSFKRSERKKYSKKGARLYREYRSSKDIMQPSVVSLMDKAANGILIHDYDFRPLYINEAYAKMLGYRVEEIMAFASIDRLFSENDMRIARSHRSKDTLHEIGDVSDFGECEAKHKSGKSIILSQSVSLIEWMGQTALLLVGLDITEKHQAQKALQLSEARFRDFVDSATYSCWELDENFIITYITQTKDNSVNSVLDNLKGKAVHELEEPYTRRSANSDKWARHYDDLAKRRAFKDFVIEQESSDGEINILKLSGKPIYDRFGQFCGYRGITQNITNEERLSEQLMYQASHDELTGLINRRHFDNEIHKAIDDAIVHDSEHVLIFMDLDRFKIVNDTCGHMAGDELLQQISSMFQSIFSRRDVLGRMGGDEFAVILKNCSPEQSTRITQKLHEEFERFRFFWEDKSFSIGVSAGVAAINRFSDSVSTLLQNVDSALYVAKQTGRNRTHVFSEKDEEFNQRQGEMSWISRIMDAVENDGFVLFAQPIMPLANDDLGGFYELLIRMKDGDKLIAPGLFLPAAESYDLSLKIDKWVLHKALEWISMEPSSLLNCQHIFINLSGKTIGNEEFQKYAFALLEEFSVPPEKICFEITETAAIANISQAIDFINDLKKLGCYFALDDFGSGVSSFGYLKNLPVDYLKIDGMFVQDMSSNEINLALIKSINDIGHVMGKKTIAEFVEDDNALAKLSAMGVDYAQGYHVGHPIPLSDLKGE